MSSGGGDGHKVAEFQLSQSSILKIQKGDITRWSIDGSSDAIVNPANERMLGGRGADGVIHDAAGPDLRSACFGVPEVRPGVRCPTGEARITPYVLPIRVGTGSVSQPEISSAHHISGSTQPKNNFYVLFLVGLVGFLAILGWASCFQAPKTQPRPMQPYMWTGCGPSLG